MNKNLTYISLFSSAGVGCFGFKQEGFECVATNEIIERRLHIQKVNNKCKYDTGYICGDIQQERTKQLIKEEYDKWGLEKENIEKSLTVLIATPPCQGMSVANRRQNDKEINRNSLVVESILLVNELYPNFFVFENVPAFMNTLCINKENAIKPISQEIYDKLSNRYEYISKVVNLKNYGNNSSRTRTLVIGIKKELSSLVKPMDLFPLYRNEISLRNVIGEYKSLEWGEIDGNDIWHSFRTYAPNMREWIHDVPQGHSAFDNIDETKRPHRVVNGEIVQNQNKCSGKYTRNLWDKVAPCIHTRNDALASQSTIHPQDDRVFSIRELMDLMTIPKEFKWVENEDDLNLLSIEEKRKVLAKNESNIRKCIGESVPTNVFKEVAQNIKTKIIEQE